MLSSDGRIRLKPVGWVCFDVSYHPFRQPSLDARFAKTYVSYGICTVSAGWLAQPNGSGVGTVEGQSMKAPVDSQSLNAVVAERNDPAPGLMTLRVKPDG